MKHYTLGTVFCLITFTLAAQIRTPAPSPLATVAQAVGLTKVTVEYSRPSAKGRAIFGDLVPYDKVWRTGANKITVIKFDDAVTLNGRRIAAGSYGWYTIPGQYEWTIALNTDDKQWGAYEYDEKKDVLRLSVMPERLTVPEEHLTIEFDNFTPTGADVVLRWERTAVRFRVEHDPHEQIMAKIKEVTAKADAKVDDFYTAAEYYRDHNQDLRQALIWANKVLETDKMWWSYYLRASIEAKLGLCNEAVADARIALDGAKKDKDDAYVKLSEQILRMCGR